MDSIDATTPHIIVVGNEKGGSGKSTTAAHMIVGFLRTGVRVAALDLDSDQRSLTRFFENRAAYAAKKRVPVPQPEVLAAPAPSSDAEAVSTLQAVLGNTTAVVIVVDTPGSASVLGRAAHGVADTLVTPLNDSFVDFDVLAQIDPMSYAIRDMSHYSAMVWEQKKQRAARDGGTIDWIVMRNRLSALDAVSKRQLAALLDSLSRRVGFRLVAGFGERVIFRELFPRGLTIMDIRDTGEAGGLTLSQIAARQEVRTLIEAIRRP